MCLHLLNIWMGLKPPPDFQVSICLQHFLDAFPLNCLEIRYLIHMKSVSVWAALLESGFCFMSSLWSCRFMLGLYAVLRRSRSTLTGFQCSVCSRWAADDSDQQLHSAAPHSQFESLTHSDLRTRLHLFSKTKWHVLFFKSFSGTIKSWRHFLQLEGNRCGLIQCRAVKHQIKTHVSVSWWAYL